MLFFLRSTNGVLPLNETESASATFREHRCRLLRRTKAISNPSTVGGVINVLNVETFFDLRTVKEKLTRPQLDYNQVRPHSALGERSPEEFVCDGQHTRAQPHCARLGRRTKRRPSRALRRRRKLKRYSFSAHRRSR